jgi:hypothetical protein
LVYHTLNKTFLDKLATRSVDELRQLARTRFNNATTVRIEGTDKAPDGSEMSVVIDEDHELDAYLTHVQGRKATFVFLLKP